MNSSLRILYNSVCPVCREGICYFENRTRASGTSAAAAGIIYIDISEDPAAFAAQGVTLNDVRLKLHAQLPSGKIVKGWPAIAALWTLTPGFGWLARLGNLPVLNWGARAAYHLTAHSLWHWNRLSKRW